LTTSDSNRGGTASPRISTAKLLVIIAIVGAVAFGLYIGYLAYTNDSFPTAERPFANYANVTSYSFNGTEFAFTIRWENASAVPRYAQLSSPDSDAANTAVCDLQISSASTGQTIFLPFTISPESPALQDVSLYIAVHPVTGGDFSIMYSVASVSAGNGLILPSNVTCQQPLGSY
jgi:hypothetical protein